METTKLDDSISSDQDINTTQSSIDKEEDFSEEELKRAEEFKDQGNQFVKGRLAFSY